MGHEHHLKSTEGSRALVVQSVEVSMPDFVSRKLTKCEESEKAAACEGGRKASCERGGRGRALQSISA